MPTSRLRAILLATSIVCAAMGCSSDDDASSSSSSGGSSSSSSSGGSSSGSGGEGNLDEIDGIAMPVTLAQCGQITPGVSARDIEFTLSGAPAETTHYAVRLAKGPAESEELPSEKMIERVQTETVLKVGEKVSGTKYRLDAYALNERTPLCVLGGFNMVTAP
ncbi:MAG: hypothetical protein KF850_00195 [Labilithrix sp.]|nr:hypothetical protein [Labilithrix sp.]